MKTVEQAFDQVITLRDANGAAVGTATIFNVIGHPDPRAVVPLIELLGDTDPTMRQYTAYALGKQNDRRAVAPLVDMALSDGEGKVRSAAAHALDVLTNGRPVPAVMGTLQEVKGSISPASAGTLDSLMAGVVPDVIQRALCDPDMLTRAAAAQMLGLLDVTESAPLLRDLAARADDTVVYDAAVEALVRLGHPLTIQEQLDLLDDRFDPHTRATLLNARGFDEDPATIVVRALVHSKMPHREMLALKLTPWHEMDGDIVAAIVAHLSTRNPAMRRLLVRLLIEVTTYERDPRAGAALLPLVTDEDADVRAAVCEALGWFEKIPVGDSLIHALDDPVPDARKAAAWALGQRRDMEAVEPLIRLLDDLAPAVRAQAAAALRRLKDQRAIDSLERAWHDPHPAVRRRAAVALLFLDVPQPFRDIRRATTQAGPIPPVPAQDLSVLPPTLQWAITRALEAMHSHPEHHLLPAIRRSVYDAFGSYFDPAAERARARSRLWAARRVLPIFQQADALDSDEPRMLIELGEDMVAGIAMEGEIGDACGAATGGPGPHPDDIGWPAVLARNAAISACGWSMGGNPLAGPLPVPETDADEQPDAPACAAMAEAWVGREGHIHRVDPDRLARFWQWWLTEAVPAAWIAGNGRYSFEQ